MIAEVLPLLGNFLELVTLKEKRKYQDEKMRIEKRYREAVNSPRVDFAVLDNLEFELKLLLQSINSDLKK